MKKIWITAICLLALGSLQSCAEQDRSEAREDVNETTHEVAEETKNAAQQVGDKTAELGAKGAASITDKVYKDKEGPGGQTIYIDDNSQYYWIDDKGKKIYVSEVELKDK